MPGDTCHVCGSNRSSDPGASFHLFWKKEYLTECLPTWCYFVNNHPTLLAILCYLCYFAHCDIKSYSRGFSVPAAFPIVSHSKSTPRLYSRRDVTPLSCIFSLKHKRPIHRDSWAELVKYAIAVCSYAMQNCGLQVCNGDMRFFQSGCEAQIQTVRTHSDGHAISIVSHANTSPQRS